MSVAIPTATVSPILRDDSHPEEMTLDEAGAALNPDEHLAPSLTEKGLRVGAPRFSVVNTTPYFDGLRPWPCGLPLTS